MKFSALTVAVVATLAATTVSAQTYTVKLGGAYIVPNATSTYFSGTIPGGFGARQGVDLEVQSKAALLFSVERAINDNFGVELVLGIPPKHDVKLQASDAVKASSNPLDQHFAHYAGETIATVKQSAPTLFFNYKYGSAGDALRPYLGLGINYTKLDTKLNSAGKELYSNLPMQLHLSSSFGPAIQAGVTYKIDKTWSLNAGVVSALVSSKLRVDYGTSEHTASFNFTPTVYTASVGYSF